MNGGGSAALTIHAGSTLDVENGPNGGGATLDDVHITNCGAFDIGDVASGAILTLQDDATITGGGIGTMTIHANSTVDVETSTNGGATLDGVHVTDNGALDIGDDLASGATLMLDNDTGISGCGAMTINAGNTLDVDGGTTTIDLGGTITNHGTLEASCGGTLDIAEPRRQRLWLAVGDVRRRARRRRAHQRRHCHHPRRHAGIRRRVERQRDVR